MLFPEVASVTPANNKTVGGNSVLIFRQISALILKSVHIGNHVTRSISLLDLLKKGEKT